MSIWDYKTIKKSLDTKEYLTFDEGKTPVEQTEINGSDVYVKREDSNPTGSWKDRGTAYKLSKLKSENIQNVVISSSGNAAISLLKYAQLYPELNVHVVVSNKNITVSKKAALQELCTEDRFTLHFADNAKRERSRIAKEEHAVVLSTAQDDDVLKGYWSLGFELADLINKKIQKKVPLFIQVSSGATLVGTVQGLSMKLQSEDWMPHIVVCQTESVHPLVPHAQTSDQVSLAPAISDRSALRSPQILKIISETQGSALAIENYELRDAKETMENKIDNQLSYNSLLSIAALIRYQKENTIENALCIASGT